MRKMPSYLCVHQWRAPSLRPTHLPFGMLQPDGQLGEHVLPVDVGREPILFDDVLPDGRQFQVTVTGTELFRRGHRVGSEPDVRAEERGGLHAERRPRPSSHCDGGP